MIGIEFSTAVALSVGIMSLGTLLFWLSATWRQSVDQNIQHTTEEIYQCDICFYLYFDRMNQKLTICPRCGSYSRKEESGEWRVESGKG